MGIRRVPGNLPLSLPYQGVYNVNIQDEQNIDNPQTAPAPGTSVRTQGATLIVPINIQPPQQKAWSLQALAIHGYLYSTMRNPSYGKIGKITVGLLLPTDQSSTVTTSAGFQTAYIPGILPRPDPSLAVDLWDPEVDPYPPAFKLTDPPPTQLSQFLAVAAVLQLPQGVQLEPGEQAYIGLWQAPSLLGGWSVQHFPPGPTAGVIWQLGLTQATYVLTYDDNL